MQTQHVSVLSCWAEVKQAASASRPPAAYRHGTGHIERDVFSLAKEALDECTIYLCYIYSTLDTLCRPCTRPFWMKVSSSHWAQPTWQKRWQEVRLRGGPTTGHNAQAGVCRTQGPAQMLYIQCVQLTMRVCFAHPVYLSSSTLPLQISR